MADSRRLDANIQTLLASAGEAPGEQAWPAQEEEQGAVPAALASGESRVSATMLSELYWPRDKTAGKLDDDLKLPLDVRLRGAGEGVRGRDGCCLDGDPLAPQRAGPFFRPPARPHARLQSPRLSLPTFSTPRLSQVQAMLQAYGRGYHRLKSPRKLVWSPSRGQVALEVTVGGQTMECMVRGPRHACLRWSDAPPA